MSEPGSVVYQHNPRPVGGPVSFELRNESLIVDNGRAVREVRLDQVEQLRLTYDARSLGQRAFRATIRLRDGRALRVSSLSWKSFVEAERRDEPYRRLITVLSERIGRLNPRARFVAGQPRPAWIAVLALSGGSMAAIAVFIWRALEAGAQGAALMGALLGAAGLWQLVPMVRLNRPRTFPASSPPADLLPGA
jgi:hypothetical protein